MFMTMVSFLFEGKKFVSVEWFVDYARGGLVCQK